MKYIKRTTPLADANMVVFDLETTGLDPDTCHIAEVAGLRNPLTGGSSYFSALTWLPKDVQMPADAYAKNNLSASYLRTHGMHVSNALQLLRNLSEECVLVAHNAAFDVAFLNQAYAYAFGVPFRQNFLCTKTLAVALLPGLASYSLVKICEHLGVEHPQAHRAMFDVKATAFLLTHLLELPSGWEKANELVNCCGQGAGHYPVAYRASLPGHARIITQTVEPAEAK